MTLCHNCKHKVKYSADLYCGLSGKLTTRDTEPDDDCKNYEPDAPGFDITTGLEIN